jgi:hypothetical protein
MFRGTTKFMAVAGLAVMGFAGRNSAFKSLFHSRNGGTLQSFSAKSAAIWCSIQDRIGVSLRKAAKLGKNKGWRRIAEPRMIRGPTLARGEQNDRRNDERFRAKQDLDECG